MKVYKATNVGLVRETNEDSLIEIPPATYIVADGMGGHAAGEVASQLLIQTAQDCMQQCGAACDEACLVNIILRANKAILKEADRHPQYAGMGTTATLFHREGENGCWAHVGDSRLYLLRDGALQQVTRDHSLVEDLVQNGSITEEQARSHPRRNVLTRAVGVDAEVEVDKGVLPLRGGDHLLLCTDGLTNMLTDERICEILQDASIGDKADALVNEAIKAGGLDNITAIVVEYDEN